MTSRIHNAVAAAALVIGVSSCTGTDGPTTAATTTTAVTPSSAATSASPTTTAPDPAQEAGAAVVAFYEELDAVAQGKARLDSFQHAISDGRSTEDTLPKWQGLLSSQLFGGTVQVGETIVTVLDSNPGKKTGGRPSWTVVACVDHSKSHLEKKGKVLDWPGQVREQITHVVFDPCDWVLALLRDDPGMSC